MDQTPSPDATTELIDIEHLKREGEYKCSVHEYRYIHARCSSTYGVYSTSAA